MSNPSRDYQGQYTFSKNMHLTCICGHVLGVHAADNETGKRPCFNEDVGLNNPIGWPDVVATGEYCDCTHFRKKSK